MNKALVAVICMGLAGIFSVYGGNIKDATSPDSNIKKSKATQPAKGSVFSKTSETNVVSEAPAGGSGVAPAKAVEVKAEKKIFADTGKLSFPISLLKLEPKDAEYGTLPDPDKFQVSSGPGVIDTTPVRDNNNAQWFWPKDVKIVSVLPPEDFKFKEGERYSSDRTNVFSIEGFFVTGVGLWGRTRNMYHWVEYAIPEGAGRFTADVLVSDDPFGWMAGRKEEMNQQFTFYVTIDGKQVARQGATRLTKRDGSGEELMKLNLSIPSGAQTIRFALEVTNWGGGNKNVELVITEGMFHAAVK